MGKEQRNSHIKCLRECAGLTYSNLSERFGLSEGRIGQICRTSELAEHSSLCPDGDGEKAFALRFTYNGKAHVYRHGSIIYWYTPWAHGYHIRPWYASALRVKPEGVAEPGGEASLFYLYRVHERVEELQRIAENSKQRNWRNHQHSSAMAARL